MNGRDVLITAALLITGLVIGYVMGRDTVPTEKDTVTDVAPTATAVVPEKPVPTEKDTVTDVAPSPPAAAAPQAKATAPTVAPTAPTQPLKQLYPFSLSGVPLLGEPAKAKVAIILFSDFQ